jgi:hypothetical protein
MSNIPYNIEDTPKIFDRESEEYRNLILEMNNNMHVKKAVFVYDKNKKFIRKYQGVTHAQKDLGISHLTIKKHAELNNAYTNYIFSFERLNTDLN